jgi:apolipoprotein N-acyltransferase
LNRPVVQYLLSALAGLALPFAFAPFEQFWIAPLSYAVLLYLWRDAAPKRALGLGFAYGCASFGFGTYWTYIAVRIIGQAPVFVGVTLTAGLVIVLAAFVAVAGFTAARSFRTSGAVAWLATLPALFVVGEWLRGWLFTGFGWLAAGYSQTDSWLMGYAPLGGIHAMSLGVLVTAGALLTLWFGSHRERAVAVVVAAAVWLGGLALRDRELTHGNEGTIEVALVTAAVAQTTKYDPAQLQPTLALYAELTRQGAGADLIVWPEAAIPVPIELVSGWVESVRRRAAEQGSTLLFGALRTVPATGDTAETYENVLLALTDDPQVYVKRHLVPFGEFYPVPDFIRDWMRLMNLPYNDLGVGAADQPPLAVAGERISVTICYEDVFGAEQLRHLADTTLLVNVSNDGWFGQSIAIPQHLQIARVRAAEAGRYLVRAANRGITAVIDPHGRLVETIEPFHAGLLRATVRGYTGSTPYARVGNWLVVGLALVSLLAVLVASPRRAMPASADLHAAR